MKTSIYLLISYLFLAVVSCNEQSKEENESASSTIKYTSPIRPNSSVWKLGEVFIDTLVYQNSNFDYDYAFTVFKTVTGDTAYLNYTEEIDAALEGSTFEIRWEIDSFFQAGENNELYFAERLLSYKILEKAKRSLIIKGNNIWIREQPKTGKVVFTLDEEAVCTILEKGEEQVIGENKDFWYKIEYGGKVGWVFGSQTSIKQKASEDSFETFVNSFLQTCFYGKNIDSLIHFKSSTVHRFINSEIGFFRLYNPGAACVLGGYNFYDDSGGRYYGTTYPMMDNPNLYKQQVPEGGFCEESSSPDGIYYKTIDALPNYADGANDFKTTEISIPLKYKAEFKIKVNILYEHIIAKTLYFIIAEDQWWLVVIDDCDCSA